MKYPKAIATSLIVALTATFITWKYSEANAEPSSASFANTTKSSKRLVVSGFPIKTERFDQTIIATGTLLAEESVELRSEVSGKIAKVLFDDGIFVTKGTLLVKIEDSTLQANLRRSEARRALAALREQRLVGIVDQGAVSKLDYDESVAAVAILDAEIELIKAEIDQTEIRAPFDGFVGVRLVSVGAIVNSSTPIATLQDISQLKLEFSIPERYATIAEVGLNLSFTTSGQETVFNAVVSAIEPRIDVTTRSVLIRATCSNSERQLLPGTFARVELVVSNNHDAILVPGIAVLSGLEERMVFVAQEGIARRVLVKIGARTSTHVEILDGLKSDDIVITSGIQQLRNGTEVQVVPMTESDHI